MILLTAIRRPAFIFLKITSFSAFQMIHQQAMSLVNIGRVGCDLFLDNHLSRMTITSSSKFIDWIPSKAIKDRNLLKMYCVNKWSTVFSSIPYSIRSMFSVNNPLLSGLSAVRGLFLRTSQLTTSCSNDKIGKLPDLLLKRVGTYQVVFKIFGRPHLAQKAQGIGVWKFDHILKGEWDGKGINKLFPKMTKCY